MNPRIAFPFLTLSDAALAAGPWKLSLNGGDWMSPVDFVPDWDASSTLRLEREVNIDRKIACEDLQIAESDLSLSVGTRVGTGQGRLPRLLVQEAYLPIGADVWSANLAFDLEGSKLSALLDLATEIILASPTSLGTTLAPSRAGDRLWEDRHRLRLEGEEPRFPLEVADIATLLGTSVSGAAPWYLHWSPRDWSRDLHGAIRLYLNSEQQAFVTRVEQQDLHTLQALLGDVMSQICERFLADPDSEGLFAHADPGTLGGQAAAWLKLAWPNRDVTFIRSLLENRPGAFRATMLALAEQSED